MIDDSRSTWRRGVQVLGDCTHQIYHIYSLFQDSHQEVVHLGELKEGSGVPGGEEYRVQVIVHIIFIILIFNFRISS